MTSIDVIEQRLIGAACAYLLLVGLTFLIVAVMIAAAGVRALRRRIARRRDHLEFLYSLPAYQGLDLTAGRARLEQAMRDHEEDE